MTAAWVSNATTLLASDLNVERVFTAARLREILQKNRRRLKVPSSLTHHRFTEALVKAGAIKRVEIKPEARTKRSQYKSFSRYLRPGAGAMEVALSLRPGSYLSHATAAHLHGLLDGPSNVIYVNKEQTPKDQGPPELSQGAINRAFKNQPRTSKFIFEFGGKRLVLLNGKNTRNYEVLESHGDGGSALSYTSIERTLVDLAVRPAYAGGASNVLRAFVVAQGRFSVLKIEKVLENLSHAYPYHQALGFYLQNAGIPLSQLTRLKALGTAFEFYLENGMKKKKLDPYWRVYVPVDA